MENKTLKRRALLLYDVAFCCLALVAVYISVCDILGKSSKLQYNIDNIITVVFIIDYIVRLIFASSKRKFVKENVLDLIAIIPFSSLLKIFRVFKLLKFLKLLKLARVSAYFIRLYKRIKFFFEINGLKYMVAVTAVCVVAGGVAIHFVEGMSLTDGLWWSFVTATTVGYGDLSPVTPFGRVVAAILMIVGIGLIGSLTSTITALFFQKKEVHASAKSDILRTIQSQLDNFDDLTEDDIETICHTLKTLHKK